MPLMLYFSNFSLPASSLWRRRGPSPALTHSNPSHALMIPGSDPRHSSASGRSDRRPSDTWHRTRRGSDLAKPSSGRLHLSAVAVPSVCPPDEHLPGCATLPSSLSPG
ncbi:hypothetical protein KOW79_010247 [Hemibagrus wyckioides]|uniref:Uncharacterized protein n=1 Tax=Hemibagrus wyckioides TaxID=337641 RepID=A0A9D3NNQ4_9TELE|nr:hypothetical protein KOW79_010247 [Hemibagrus wyckioides]